MVLPSGKSRSHKGLFLFGLTSTYIHKSKLTRMLRHVHGVVIPQISKLFCVMKRSCRYHGTMNQSARKWCWTIQTLLAVSLAAHIFQSRAYVAPNRYFSDPWSKYTSEPGAFVFRYFSSPILNNDWEQTAFSQCFLLPLCEALFHALEFSERSMKKRCYSIGLYHPLEPIITDASVWDINLGWGLNHSFSNIYFTSPTTGFA